MKKIATNNQTAKKLASYSALAGAFILVNSGAKAQSVYTDVNPDETYSNDGEFYEIDLNLDGSTDFTVAVLDFTYPGFFYSTGTLGYTWAGLIRGVVVHSYNGSVAGSSGASGTFLPYALNNNVDVDGGLSFHTNATYGVQTMVFYLGVLDYPAPGSTFGFFTGGNWNGKTDKFLGFRLHEGGNDYYGWARLDVESNKHEFTIKDFAYNATPDATITTSTTMTGVHNVIQNDQLSAYSYGNAINVVVKDLQTKGATVKVFNLTGEVVYQNELNTSGMNIVLDKVATGDYTLQVITDENGVYTKKLFVQN